jgi:flagellar protein FliO/FliZ
MTWVAFALQVLVYALLLAAAVLAGLWSYRVFTTGDTSFSFAWLFPPKPVPRLAVMEQASVDRMRRLVLIRRDDIEHLIMTGGPVDVVIETGIAAPLRMEDDMGLNGQDRQEPDPPVFARKTRTFGQAVNE